MVALLNHGKQQNPFLFLLQQKEKENRKEKPSSATKASFQFCVLVFVFCSPKGVRDTPSWVQRQVCGGMLMPSIWPWAEKLAAVTPWGEI